MPSGIFSVWHAGLTKQSEKTNLIVSYYELIKMEKVSGGRI